MLLTGCAEPPDTETTTSSLQAVSCESLHAARIAKDYVLADCDSDPIPDAALHASAGAGLSDASCTGQTADACARHFRAVPDRGMVDNASAIDSYEALHFALGPNDPLMPDGSRPMLYYRAGSGIHANDWIIFLQGGANMCTTEVDQTETLGEASSLTTLGRACFDKLDYDRQSELAAGTGFHRERWKDLSDVGILGEAAANPDFASYNRVFIVKPNDGWVGARTHLDVGFADDAGQRWQIRTMQTRGDEIVRHALGFLANSGGRTRDFHAASNVLFVASSTGINAVQRIDDWNDEVVALTTAFDNTPAYVGMMLDSQIMLPDQWVYEAVESGCSSIYPNDCPGASDPPGGQLAFLIDADDGRTMTFDARSWDDYKEVTYDGGESQLASGEDWTQYESVGAQLDRSCLLDDPQPWRCRSRQYVMLNHVATPLFLGHSYHDGSDGVINGQTHRLASGSLPRWHDVAVANPGERPLEILTRRLLNAYVDHRDTLVGGAIGDSKLAGPLGVWVSDCGQHEPVKHRTHFSSGEVRITNSSGNGPLTLSAALRRWFELGVPVIRIDGRGLGNTVYSQPATPPAGCEAD